LNERSLSHSFFEDDVEKLLEGEVLTTLGSVVKLWVNSLSLCGVYQQSDSDCFLCWSCLRVLLHLGLLLYRHMDKLRDFRLDDLGIGELEIVFTFRGLDVLQTVE